MNGVKGNVWKLNLGSQLRVTKRRIICSERQGWKMISETSL